MKIRAFVAYSCGLFLVIGPLLPMPVMAFMASIYSGDISKMIVVLDMF